jgi:D-alanine transaminase
VHVPSQAPAPTVVATFRRKPSPDAELQRRGMRVCTMEDIRWARCFIKSVALLPTVLAKMEAVDRGFDDALFVGADGEVREATAANVFAVRGRDLWTPPKSRNILHGVTRTYVLECARKTGIPIREARLTVSELLACDEAFLSSTTLDIMPVTRLNEKTLSGGACGPVTHRLLEAFRAGLAEA